ncbi:MAG: hypothetical protein H8D56_27000 [Planctomycetes bacterium]|nr:hypothetical protein [Planctomycetota bacterium]
MANLIYRTLFTLIYALLYLFMGWSIYALIAKGFSWKNTNLFSVSLKFSLKKLTTPEVTAALIIVLIFSLAAQTSFRIWRTEIEPKLTFEAIANKFAPDILIKLFSTAGTIEARPQLEIQMELINEHIIDLQSGKKKWTKESLEGKHQYLIRISNKSSNDIEDLRLDLQFPFFVNYQKIIEERKVSGRSIEANFTRHSASPTLSVEVIGELKPMSFTVGAHRISPKGILEILFILEKTGLWVKDIPPPGSQMARMLKSGKCEFIHGTFTYKEQVFEIYYPIEIRKDKSLFLGPPENKMPPNAIVVLSLG